MPNENAVNDPNADASNGDATGGQMKDESGQRLIPANKVNEIVSSRVNELNSKHAMEMELLKRKIEETARVKEKPVEQVYTRADLDGFITEGRLTQEGADQIIDKQLTNQITTNVTEHLMIQQKQEALGKVIENYVAHDPDVAISGTDARNRVETEVMAQFNLSGDTEMTLKHEALALRAIYGDEKKLGQVDLKPHDRDTHMGTIGGSSGNAGNTGDTLSKNLSSDEKHYYQDLINKGIYPGWDAVMSEMKYADESLRARVRSR